MALSTCCLFLRRPQCQKQTTTCGMESEYSECMDMHHVFRRIIDGKFDRTFAAALERPALICKTKETTVTRNEMVE